MYEGTLGAWRTNARQCSARPDAERAGSIHGNALSAGESLHGPRSDRREYGLRGRRAFFSVFGKRRCPGPAQSRFRQSPPAGRQLWRRKDRNHPRAPTEDTARQIRLEAVATASLPLRARPEFFRFSFFVPRERGGTADFDLCFGRTEPETAGHRSSYRRRTPCRPRARSW
jgi:hypothetical protein